MEIKNSDTLAEIIRKLEGPAGGARSLTVNVPADSPLLKNLLNVKILLAQAEKLGIKLKIETKDQRGENLLAHLSEPRPEDLGFAEGIDIVDQKRRPHLKGLLVFLILAGLVVVGVFSALIVVPRATVTLRIGSETLVQSFELLASPSASVVGKEQKILPAVLLEVEETGERKAPATGKKQTGEKSQGAVTIYNWTDDEKTFAQDTPITLIRVEGEKLRFLLDKEVSIPAQTASVSATLEERTTTYTPGKKSVAVVAEKIGEDYNLSKGEEFSIQSLSTDDFLAQNDEGFAGGKKQEITVVTATDQMQLSERLQEELIKQAEKDLLSRTVGDQKLHPEAIDSQIREQTFDREVEEEAKEIKLTLALKSRAVVYSQDQLRKLVSGLLEQSIPEGFNLADRDLVTEVAAAKTAEMGDGKPALQLLVKIKAFITSQLDREQIKRDVAGRSLPSAQQYLKKLPNISSVEITTFPPLPGPFYRMPKLPSRIDIKLERE